MRYLSEEWISAADNAIRDHAPSAPATSLIIDQHVGDHVSYRIVIAGPASSIQTLTPGDTVEPPADATFRQELETAFAIAQRSTDAHQAFLLGHIRFEGDINLLIEQRPAFDWLEQALAPILAETRFD